MPNLWKKNADLIRQSPKLASNLTPVAAHGAPPPPKSARAPQNHTAILDVAKAAQAQQQEHAQAMQEYNLQLLRTLQEKKIKAEQERQEEALRLQTAGDVRQNMMLGINRMKEQERRQREEEEERKRLEIVRQQEEAQRRLDEQKRLDEARRQAHLPAAAVPGLMRPPGRR